MYSLNWNIDSINRRKHFTSPLFIKYVKIFIKILLLLQSINYVFCFEQELTVEIEAGKKDCFYHNVNIGEIIDIEYQVIDGGHGELDISFELIESTGRILLADFKKSENVHRHKALITGDYKFCFDNQFSTFNQKTVFFELTIDNDNNQIQNDNQHDQQVTRIEHGLGHHNSQFPLLPRHGTDSNDGNVGDTKSAETYDNNYVNIQDILDYTTRIHAYLMKSRQIQELLKSQEARDRNIAEENYFKVNTWSMFQIIFMIVIGLLQVIMVRSIFDTDSIVSGIWKKINF